MSSVCTPSSTNTQRMEKVLRIVAPVALLGLTLAIFADVLFGAKDVILSLPGMDLFTELLHWRSFGFSELRHGNLALWNPYIYSGTPCLEDFQSALLYPPNLLFVVLPLAKAVNWSIALHVYLAGLFTYLWVSHRGLHPAASLLAGVFFMFGGTYFYHIIAGHLPNLCTMVWLPLILLCIDHVFLERSWRWCLGGILAVAMSILAGHPQYFFFGSVATGIYVLLCLLKADKRAMSLFQVAIMYAGAVALTAVQILPGMDLGHESVRSGGIPLDVAQTFSLPGISLLLLVFPKLFGDNTVLPYWGRWNPWEMTFCIGTTGFFLAVYGALCGDRRLRRFSILLTLLCVCLAIGSYTPLHKFLYTWVPGFNRFRGMSKFVFPASLFLVMLAGIGLSRVLRGERTPRAVLFLFLCISIACSVAGLALWYSVVTNPMGFWHGVMMALYHPEELAFYRAIYESPDLVIPAGFHASKILILAAGYILALSILLRLSNRSRRWGYLIVLLGGIEIFLFAKPLCPTFETAALRNTELERVLAAHPGDYRFLYAKNSNLAISLAGENLWGDNPLFPRRYAEFIHFTQGENPDSPMLGLNFFRYSPLYSLLRCRYFFEQENLEAPIITHEYDNYLPRFQLISECAVMPDRQALFTALQDPSFDPRAKVLLESKPDPEPAPSDKPGTFTVLDHSTDHWTLEVDLPSPAILLMADSYTKGWRAQSLAGSVQRYYDVLPADYILRGVPLSAGHHHLRIEYLPMAFRIGKWISILSALFYVLAAWRCRPVKACA